MNTRIGIYYEHPKWFEPLFAALDKRGLEYEKIDAAEHSFDPEAVPDFGLLFNRMSASAYLRGNTNAIFYTSGFLANIEKTGVRVINGYDAYQVEISKALQLSLLASLGLRSPKTRVVNSLKQLSATRDLSFPVVVKPNIGGRGAGIVKFDSPDELQAGINDGFVDLGIDGTAIIQEYVLKRGGHINRVETLGGKFLYALKIYPEGENFNLCPAEVCLIENQTQAGEMCLFDAPPTGMRIEIFTPSAEIIESVERIVRAAKIEVGGVEYLIDDRTGDELFYDINALSNFVANAETLVGFDPHEKLVDFLVKELEKCATDIGCRSSAAG